MWKLQYSEKTIQSVVKGLMICGSDLDCSSINAEKKLPKACQYWNHDKIHSCISNWAIGDVTVK